MKRIQQRELTDKPYEGLVSFWRKLAVHVKSGKKITSIHIKKYYLFYKIHHSVEYDEDRIKEALSDLSTLMDVIIEWGLGEISRPSIDWKKVDAALLILDAYEVDFGPKY